jgi:hypothetical protein
MRLRASITVVVLFASLSLFAQTPRPASTDNVDTCDISVMPAATLLLPYFEVDTSAPPGAGTTTLFTVTNTSRYPQIAHVTIWTDWAFPVLGFNLFLTGYDVQGINLYDLIMRGVIAPGSPAGTSINTAPGSLSAFHGVVLQTNSTPLSNTSNPNFITSGPMNVSTTCAALPGVLPADLTAAVKNALTGGTGYNAGGVNCSRPVGFNHGPMAKGYVTIDVVSYCTTQFPSDAGGIYFTGPAAAILFDNVLSGDYEQIGPSPAALAGGGAFDAEGGPMVHIRAIPEGGLSGAGGGIPLATNLPFTFYDRYTQAGARAADRRQPLPSVWSARVIEGGPGNGLATDLKIWREGNGVGQPSCGPASELVFNAVMPYRDAIRFDEHENSSGLVDVGSLPCCLPSRSLPATSRTSSTSYLFPPLGSTDAGGWLYLDLSSGARSFTTSNTVCHQTLSAQRAGFGTCDNSPALLGFGGSRTTTQNWVISSMFGKAGANRLAVDVDAVALGNGCTPGAVSPATVGPAWHPGGLLICPSGAPGSTCGAGTVRPPVNP